MVARWKQEADQVSTADVARRGPPVAPCAHAAAPPSRKTQVPQALPWELSHHISIAKLEADSLIAGEGVVVVGGSAPL